MNKKILIGLLVIIIVGFYLIPNTPDIVPDTKPFEGEIIKPSTETALVTRVIDGDTVVLENDERVRLLGIDTPERGQYFFKESKEWLVNRIEGKKVILEFGHENRDKYDRLLRYIHINDELINIELVRLGYATAYIFEEDEYSEKIREAEQEARRVGLGIWAIDIEDVFCIGIHYFHYNAKGNDNENLNDEYVTFRNKCTYPVEISGWILKDEIKKTYIFPEFILMNKSTVTIHTGSGRDNETDLYWSNSRAIWNNAGDSLYLWDEEDNLILNHTY